MARQRGLELFLQVSTDEVYGSLALEGKDAFLETTPIAPNSPYAASKAGVMCLTKSFSKALAKFNILVNSVSPGQIDTDLNKLFPEDMNRIFMEAIPLGHYGQPEDIAEAVAFLCSDKARWITGEIFNVDGGEAAMVS